MKRLLFVVGCLLLLLAAAAPASAADKIQWQVLVNYNGLEGPPVYVCLNYTDMYWTDLDAKGRPFTSVPADATDVRVGTSAAFVNYGDMTVFAKSYFQRLKVWDPGGNKVIDIDESTSQMYWTAPYRYNDWTSPYGPMLPYNPNIGQGMMWGMDWVPRVPPPSGSATLKRGTYRVTFTDMLTHRCADPMFWWRVPGGEGYPPLEGPWDWDTSMFALTFQVK